MRVPVALATLCLASAFALAPAAHAQQDPNMPPPPGAMTPQGAGQPPGPPPPGGTMMMAPQAGQPLHGKARFDAANTTHDGRLTPDQAQAAGWRPIVRHFQEIDADHKGYVTFQDIRTWQRARHAAQAAARGAPPQGGAMSGPPPGAMSAPPPGAPPPSGQQY